METGNSRYTELDHLLSLAFRTDELDAEWLEEAVRVCIESELSGFVFYLSARQAAEAAGFVWKEVIAQVQAAAHAQSLQF